MFTRWAKRLAWIAALILLSLIPTLFIHRALSPVLPYDDAPLVPHPLPLRVFLIALSLTGLFSLALRRRRSLRR